MTSFVQKKEYMTQDHRSRRVKSKYTSFFSRKSIRLPVPPHTHGGGNDCFLYLVRNQKYFKHGRLVTLYLYKNVTSKRPCSTSHVIIQLNGADNSKPSSRPSELSPPIQLSSAYFICSQKLCEIIAVLIFGTLR